MNAVNMPRWRLELPRATPLDTLSILVVDDDPMVREATAGILADAGHSVTEAGDGFDAMHLLSRHGHFDLVISDITMPRMSGLALSQAVADCWPGLPVLLVSGRPQPPGARLVMMKPFNATTLLQAVAASVEAAKGGFHPGL